MQTTKTDRGKVLKITKDELLNLSENQIRELYKLDPHRAAGVAMIPITQQTSKNLTGTLIRYGYERKIGELHGFTFWAERERLMITNI